MERGEEEARPALERQARQVVGGTGEAFGLLELGHRLEAPVVREAPAVVAAAQHRDDALLLDHQVRPVRAHVRERVESARLVAGERDRLGQRAFEERAGQHAGWPRELLRIGDELPAAGEDGFLLAGVDLRVRIEPARRGLGAADVGVDREHARHEASGLGGQSNTLAAGRRSPQAAPMTLVALRRRLRVSLRRVRRVRRARAQGPARTSVSSPFETGARHRLVHAVALVALGFGDARLPAARGAGLLFVLGTVLFSGSLYALALSGVRAWGAVTPLGGLAFLAGWAWLAWAAFVAVRGSA
jgi:uncharacterized membrane protein YgdD (TMEM256/DUF423 family)